jgi:hypothetical protein
MTDTVGSLISLLPCLTAETILLKASVVISICVAAAVGAVSKVSVVEKDFKLLR